MSEPTEIGERGRRVSKPAIDQMIAEHRAAIARQEAPVSHATIIDVLADLAAGQITEGQALSILRDTARHVAYAPDHAALYLQAIDALQAMQTNERPDR